MAMMYKLLMLKKKVTYTHTQKAHTHTHKKKKTSALLQESNNSYNKTTALESSKKYFKKHII